MEEKKVFPKVNSLAMKNFVENFNDHYSDKLNEKQKEFLNKYITSNPDNNLEFKSFLYEEIDKLKNYLAPFGQ